MVDTILKKPSINKG